MDFLTDPHWWSGWVRIVVIDLLLADDNALVIALAVLSLPLREQFWGRLFGTGGAAVVGWWWARGTSRADLGIESTP